VVTIFDSGTDNGQAFLVMELLPGPSLQAYVTERGQLPETEAVALAAQIASGLAAAHQAGLVHRDIKPSNVMFDAQGKAKIVDFGIARLTEGTTTGLTITNAVIGSPPYLSPEQYRGEAADERSDLYALGCVLTTLLTGRPPFEAQHPLAYGHQHVHATAPAVSDRRPDVSPALDALVRQLLSKDPKDRPQSALDVKRQLTEPEHEPTPALSSPPEAAAAAAPPTRALPASEPPTGAAAARRPRLGPMRSVAAVALLLALAAASLLFATTRADAPTASQAPATPAEGSPPPLQPTTAAPEREPDPTENAASAPGETSSAPENTTEPQDDPPGEEGGEPRADETDETEPAEEQDSDSSAPSPASPTPDNETSTGSSNLQEAVTDLQAAAREAIGSGQIDDKKAEGLMKRVDQLARQLSETPTENGGNKVDELDRYLSQLSSKDELTPAAADQLQNALEKVRQQLDQ
jgi:serine/threonine protein kinase